MQEPQGQGQEKELAKEDESTLNGLNFILYRPICIIMVLVVYIVYIICKKNYTANFKHFVVFP